MNRERTHYFGDGCEPPHDPVPDLYDVARQVTDDVLGEGTYAQVNAGNPDPGVQAAIQRASDIDPTTMEVVAWVGADEFDGSRGIKSARTPAGWIPLAAKGEHEAKLRDGHLRAQLQNQANTYDVTIHLVRFRYVEVIETLTPGN